MIGRTNRDYQLYIYRYSNAGTSKHTWKKENIRFPCKKVFTCHHQSKSWMPGLTAQAGVYIFLILGFGGRKKFWINKSKKYIEFIQSKYKNSNASFKKFWWKIPSCKDCFSKSILNGFLWCGFKNLNSEFRISSQSKTSSDKCIIWNKKF